MWCHFVRIALWNTPLFGTRPQMFDGVDTKWDLSSPALYHAPRTRFDSNDAASGPYQTCDNE